MTEDTDLRFGVQLWSQGTDWRAFRGAAVAADQAGWDSIWTWDHLLAIVGPWRQPIFEGWLVLAAAGEATGRIRLGLMVAANTFRHPGLTAKLATTLDHITDGRAILGIGGAWMEREHEAFGIPFDGGPGERLDRLDEAVGIIRRLLDGEEFTHHGRFYDLVEASQLPRPIQDHLPILIGGAGPRKTLRIVARHADGWNASGTLQEMAERDRILAEHCAAEGRDPATIERTTTFLTVIRDDPREARRVLDAQLAHNGLDEVPTAHPLALGSPADVAEVMRPYVELGFRSPIVRLPSPFDRETIERLPELKAALGGA
jgi:alkanesulfonate monooxygenase SsuD/methylene tetrahydromethanopterin reductase-like flavin-dependent oxidoreductase (luciferase family)